MSERQYRNYDKIAVGDAVGVCATVGMCTGGGDLGIANSVVAVNSTDILLDDGQTFSRENGYATSPPWAYKIGWWVKEWQR